MSEVDLGAVMVTLSPAPASTGKPTSFRTATFSSPEALVKEAPFALALPGVTLPGHAFQDGALIKEPAVAAALTYVEVHTGRHYIVVQSPVVPEDAGAKPLVRAVGEEISSTSIGQQDAALVVSAAPPGTPRPVTLIWSRDSVLFQVIGIGYALADLEAIGQSL